MLRFSIVLSIAVALGGCTAQGMRDDPSSPMALGLAAIDNACRTDPSQVTPDLARALGVTGVQVRKAMGRHTLTSLDRGDLCARPESERRKVIAASQQAKKQPSEASQQWLLRQLGGASGVIDHTAVSQALEQRRAMLSAPMAKRAGLPASPAGWTNLSAYAQSPGRINHIVFTSATGNDMLAGADGGGIWKTTDGGATWNPVNDFLGSLSISSFGRATNDASNIYAGINTSGSHTYFPFGILKSADGGTTWSQLAQTNPTTNADFTNVQRVAVHPTNSLIVLAATNGGAYQSVDGGANWTKVGGINTKAYYVAFHPTDGNRRAVAYNDGTIRYTTTGDLLGVGAATATVLAGGKYMKIAYAKSDVNRMYALLTDGSNASRLYRSSGGAAGPWAEVPTVAATLTGDGTFFNGGYLSYTGGLWVDPTNPNRVAVCEGWASFTADLSLPTPVFKSLASGWVDFHGIVEHPGYDGAANKTVFFMDDGGLYRVGNIDLLDDFAQFSRKETGLTVNQVYSVSGHGGNPILGAQDTGPRAYRTATWSFLQRPAGDPVCDGCSWIGDGATTAASTANSAVLYGSRQYLDLFRSTDGGATASSLAYNSALTEGRGATASNTNAGFIAPFVLDPSNQSRMLAGGRSLWRSTNVDTGNPPTWTAIRSPYTEVACGSYLAPVSVIAIAPSNPDVVWIAHECAGRIFKSVNATQASPTWTEVTTLPSLANNRSKTSIMIDRTNANVVWVGIGQYQASTLFKTTDGGATAGAWTAVAGLPGAPVYSMLQHPNDATWLYAATGVGLFASADNGATWSTSNEGPANVVVKSLDWNTTGVSSELLVGTFGRGVFKASITTAVLAASTTTMISSVASPSVPTSITFTATVTGGSGTPTGSVDFRDGAVSLGTVALNGSGQAAFTTSLLAVGSHSITANYLGSGTYSPSASAAFPLTITAPPNPPRLANISTRMQVLTGNNVMIAGFIIGGSTNKTVVIRARGPSLAPTGITNFLANPLLQLFSGQTQLAANDNFGTALNLAALQASGFAPADPFESAILTTLAPGAYTAIVTGAGGTTGVGLVEVFEVDAITTPLINIATRGRVLTGNDVMIAGLIIQGSGPQQVVIRARGPSLAPTGITDFLANPMLQIFQGQTQIAVNDDWGSGAQASAIQAAGFAPADSRESAVMMTLQPGAYTAIVTGVGGTVGVGIVEVFTVP